MAAVTPFTIAVPESALSTLRDKLAAATFPDEADVNGSWDYGVPLGDVKRLASYWQNGYDWRAAEAKLNELPHFTTAIAVDGFGQLDMHFVHQQASKPDSIPLLFCHGWPGSFLEVTKMLPLLAQGDADSDGPTFHVVAPSLPNFGFSSRVSKKGFGIRQHAEVCHKLMQRLGYDDYVTQGGDWGSAITRMMGILYPKHCLASHINMVIAHPPKPLRFPLQFLSFLVTPFSAREKAGLARTKWFLGEGSGYYKVQSTKPATLGMALADSPVALLAWIYEKLHEWTDGYAWTDDEVLTWISMYRFSTAGAAASVVIYYEYAHAAPDASQQGMAWNPHTAMGCSYFPRDIHVAPRAFARTLGPLVFVAEHDAGGHFAAYETPDLLARDLRRMFGEGGGAYSVTQKLLSKL